MSLGPELDAARAQVAAHGLIPQAAGQLAEVMSAVSLEALGPVKQLLKRFFSAEEWAEADDAALADAVGAGSGSGRAELEPGLFLVWGWDDGSFRLRVESTHGDAPGGADAPNEHGAPNARDEPTAAEATEGSADDLAETFDGVVVPEATPSPRTIRFVTPALHSGPSRVYEDAASADGDPRVARLFREFPKVTNVLVGPDFVAVTIARPGEWPVLLGPMLAVVTEEFTGGAEVAAGETTPAAVRTTPSDAGEADEDDPRGPRRLERAWVELGALRADQSDDLEHVLTAANHDESAYRQVAAALLADAAPDAAREAWAALLGDSSRIVRRSAVDAVAGADREELRPLLERALRDTDAWIRWKALRGLADLGPAPSRAEVEACAGDADFRVRLEAARVLASIDPT